MNESPANHEDFGSIEFLKEQLQLFRECSNDDDFLRENQQSLERLLLHSLNRDATFHDAVQTLFAIASYINKQTDQSIWQRVAWDALLGALNIKDGALQAQILTMLSRYHMLEGKHDRARKNIENAIDRAQEENSDVALLLAYIRFFELLVYQPTFASRTQVLQTVFALDKKVNQPQISMSLHYALAHFYNRSGEWQQAIGHGQMAYLLAYHYRDNYNLTRAAFIILSTCRLSSCLAVKHFLPLAEKHDPGVLHPYDHACAILHKSTLYYEMGNPTAAREGYHLAIALLKTMERPFHLAACYQSLALAQIRLKQFDEAQKNLEIAGELWEQCGSACEHANHRFTQGYLEAWRGNKKLGLTLLNEAFNLTENIPNMASRDHLRAYIEDIIRQIKNGGIQDTYRLTG